MVMKLNKMVLDNKKIEEAAQGAADLYEQDLPIMSYNEDTEVDGQHHFCQEFGAELFKDGVKWAINEFLKSLCHPASEVPQIGRGRVLAYSIDCCYRNFYNLYDMMSKTDCNIYQEMWNEQVKAYHLTGWIYADELFGLIIEGGNHD